ncbi:galactokinase [Flavobacterium collinsii]|uniref:Galactokinase n=1 Tax=Flavobacterium collinsii TaxID=1114861 RepID=A0ABN7EFY7_9FLAO|nr:galactokinase [Flavobacterium collinsii]CAA9195727.1 Galactokinase [Flavobacterium collinsii]
MNDILIQNTIAFFEKSFGSAPQKVVLSPGRINIIGEHIDYNDGYVLPAAIDKIICFAFEKNNSNSSKIIAIDLNEAFEIDLKAEIRLSDDVWTNYLRGVIKQLQENGFVFEGFNCVFSSNIPVGSGLSSSAALECGMIFGITALFDLKIKKTDIALLGQKAEHWVGINCGIMDQFSSVHGLENKVIKLDCNTLDFEYHNADFKDYALVLFDSNVKHSLFTSEYNTRRLECEQGLTIIKHHFPQIKSFRDCTEEQLLSIQDQMTPTVFKRVHFVVKEINRVVKACEALDQGNIELLGQLLFEAHYGLSQEYEVSCPELDMLVNNAKTNDFIVGSRLMGGGFGGCTINFIKKGYENEVKNKFSNLYLNTFGIELKFYDVTISNGTRLL